MRHATEVDLDHAETLLVELRKFSQLQERKRGYFSRASRAFLHFHADGDDLYVDVRLGGAFQRMRVTSNVEQTGLISHIGRMLQSEERNQC